MLNEGVSNTDGGSPGGFQHEPMRPVSEGEVDPIPRPKAIDNAFHASLASTAIASVGMLATMLFDQVELNRLARQMLANAGQRVTEADLATMIAIAKVSIGFGALLFAALFVLFALKMRAGRGWARMLLIVYAVVGALSFLAAMASTGAALSLMWRLAEVAFSVTAVVYMFRPESVTYFLEHRKRRLARRGGRPPV